MDEELKRELVDCVPSNWLDPLLTGAQAVMGSPPWGCPEVERLLRAIRARIEATCDGVDAQDVPK